MKRLIQLLLIALVAMTTSCGKKFLDLKQDKTQLVPQTLDDFQAMLDFTSVVNEGSSAALGLLGGDEYWITATQYNNSTAGAPPMYQKNAYVWADVIYQGRETQLDWSNGYRTILLTNLALERTEGNVPIGTDRNKWNLLRGNALFYRAYNYYQLAQLFCPVYNAATATKDLGLPLREDSDPTVKGPRSSLEATYQMIIADLTEAEGLLENQPLQLFRPSKAAVYALFTRVYMQLGDYAKAKDYADKCLQIQNGLIDFNTLTFTANLTFGLNGANNPEVIFLDNPSFIALVSNYANADSALIKAYVNGDLRFNAYWLKAADGRQQFKGTYKGAANSYFTGLATDEVYLNRAECLARMNKPAEALADLNKLRQNRFTPATYVALQSTDAQQVLDWVIAERRIELVFRGTRWSDLRRLNKETRYATTLVRVIGTDRYELKPGSAKWTWPLPVEAIQNGSYEQNPR